VQIDVSSTYWNYPAIKAMANYPCTVNKSNKELDERFCFIRSRLKPTETDLHLIVNKRLLFTKHQREELEKKSFRTVEKEEEDMSARPCGLHRRNLEREAWAPGDGGNYYLPDISASMTVLVNLQVRFLPMLHVLVRLPCSLPSRPTPQTS
jgi:hypothetical protein